MNGREQDAERRESNSKLFITNLPLEYPEDELKVELEKSFEGYGRIVYLNVKKSRKGGQYSFAFLEFENVEDARRAIEEMDQKDILGRPMKVRQDRQMEGCFNCKKSGHFAKECPEREGGQNYQRRVYEPKRSERPYERRRSPRRQREEEERDYYRPKHRRSSRSYSNDRRRRRYSRSEDSYSERSDYKRRDDRRRRDEDRSRNKQRRRERSRSYERYDRRRDQKYDSYRGRRHERSYSGDSRS